MAIDELFTQTETDRSVLNRRLSGDYTDITSFNEACVSAGYDMMLLFKFNVFVSEHPGKIQPVVDRVYEYLNIVCQDFSAPYIEKMKVTKYGYGYDIAWWIQKPEKFEGLLQLTYYMYRLMNKLDKTMSLNAYHIVTAENHDEIRNLRTFVYPLGRLLRDICSHKDIEKFQKRDFTLFWNNLNQQQQLFTSSYYGREIDSLDSFIRIFSHFVARKICIALKQDKRTQLNRLTYEWYRETVRKQVTKIFDER